MKPNELVNCSFRRKGQICILTEVIKNKLYKMNYFNRGTKKIEMGLGINGTGLDYFGNKFDINNVSDIKKENYD